MLNFSIRVYPNSLNSSMTNSHLDYSKDKKENLEESKKNYSDFEQNHWRRCTIPIKFRRLTHVFTILRWINLITVHRLLFSVRRKSQNASPRSHCLNVLQSKEFNKAHKKWRRFDEWSTKSDENAQQFKQFWNTFQITICVSRFTVGTKDPMKKTQKFRLIFSPMDSFFSPWKIFRKLSKMNFG